jgi:hypothetical protein
MSGRYIAKLSDMKFDEIPSSDSWVVLKRIERFYHALCKARNVHKIVTIGIFSS